MQDTLPTLTPEQRHNIAARRAELDLLISNATAELDELDALEASVGCDCCGALPAISVARLGGGSELLCQRCALRVAREDNAAAGLHVRMRAVLATWCAEWSPRLTPEQLAVILYMEGDYWHPAGALGRPQSGMPAALAAVKEALTKR